MVLGVGKAIKGFGKALKKRGENLRTPPAVKEFYDTVPPHKDPRMTGPKYKKYLEGLRKSTEKKK